MNMKQFAIDLLEKNKNIGSKPMGQTFLNVLKSGNDSAGVEMANNILSSMGVSREEGISQARQFFNM